MASRKKLEGRLADWYPHPKGTVPSLAPVVSDVEPGSASATAAVAVGAASAGGAHDDGHDDLADRFFAGPAEIAAIESAHAGAFEPVEALRSIGSKRPQTPAEWATLRARRVYLMRYVSGAVGVAAVIVVAAVVRTTIAPQAPAESSSLAATLASEPPPSARTDVSAPPLAVDTSAAEGVAQPSVASAGPAAVAETVPGADAPATDALSPPSTTAITEAPADARTASQAKSDAQRALDRGALAKAITSGEAAVALDPTDAEAWLILGAAYEARGSIAKARQCFGSCAREAKRGAVRECAALLR